MAYLSRIVLDIIRYKIMFGQEGLPFGLLGDSLNFKDISYFWSPLFWYGGSVIASRYLKYWLTRILIVSGVLAVFTGLSSALLMIPTIRPSWLLAGLISGSLVTAALYSPQS